jgi:tight adherence protein C
MLQLLASLLWALSLGGLAWIVLRIATVPRVIDPALGRFELERREELRKANSVYRWFEPLIDELVPWIARSYGKLCDQVRTNLIGSGDTLPWKPEEYIAVKRVEAVLAGLCGVFFGVLMRSTGWTIGLGLIGYFGYVWLSLRQLRARAEKRRLAIRRRLASAIDLMSLMMEVGASFQDGLATVTREAGDHPLGEEFRRILRDLSLGRPRREALKSFADRLIDDDARELMSAIIEGETLGTPLAETMRTQAEQMRLKRSQWAEKAAEESKVALVFPAMIIMAACLAIVVAPFILSALYTYPG